MGADESFGELQEPQANSDFSFQKMEKVERSNPAQGSVRAGT
jgi:hypothetical protein